VIYIIAFASLAVQVRGLIGHAGIAPLGDYLAAARQGWGAAAFWRMPTVFWLASGDAALLAVAIIGALLGLLVTCNIAQRAALVGAFALYLSLVYAGQDFMAYQWDLLLLEAGFLAIFLTAGSRIIVWLYRFLIFRFLFLAGAMKLASGDRTWRSLSALDYHFWTQPLPTPLAWYAAQLPHTLLAAATAAVLVVELGLVFLIRLPRRPRAIAARAILLFQLLIMLTGNYNFFNLLTMLLCLFLFDDAALRRVVPVFVERRARQGAPETGRPATIYAAAVALLTVPAAIDRLWQPLMGGDLPVAGAWSKAISPLLIVNSYGLFASMTTSRPTIVLEGSDDGATWRRYEFRDLPGPAAQPLRWCIPYQPRLDWQIWVAGYGTPAESPWFAGLVHALLRGSPAVLDLLAVNPFPGRPAKYLRAALYDERFADRETHARTGQWWSGRLEGLYYPAVSLADFARSPQGRGE
jgi:hypothetical protein